jgi:nitrate reductase delta subunit
VLEAVCAALPRLGVRQRDAVVRLAAEGPPDEQVGLEPFAPPEVMPLEVRS